jgi:hypothetical protein
MTSLSDFFVVFLGLFVALVIFSLLPVLIRFGNCWSEIKNQSENLESVKD